MTLDLAELSIRVYLLLDMITYNCVVRHCYINNIETLSCRDVINQPPSVGSYSYFLCS